MNAPSDTPYTTHDKKMTKIKWHKKRPLSFHKNTHFSEKHLYD